MSTPHLVRQVESDNVSDVVSSGVSAAPPPRRPCLAVCCLVCYWACQSRWSLFIYAEWKDFANNSIWSLRKDHIFCSISESISDHVNNCDIDHIFFPRNGVTLIALLYYFPARLRLDFYLPYEVCLCTARQSSLWVGSSDCISAEQFPGSSTTMARCWRVIRRVSSALFWIQILYIFL